MSTRPEPVEGPTLQELALASVATIEKHLMEIDRSVILLGVGAPEADELRHQLAKLRLKFSKRPTGQAAAAMRHKHRLTTVYTGD